MEVGRYPVRCPRSRRLSGRNRFAVAADSDRREQPASARLDLGSSQRTRTQFRASRRSGDLDERWSIDRAVVVRSWESVNRDDRLQAVEAG